VLKRCAWCRREVGATLRRDAEFCGKRCRQTAFRLRKRTRLELAGARPMRFAYADPPYPEHADLYKHEPDYGGEVDHRELVARLETGWPDGWALSTSVDALADVLPLCPRGETHTCAWVKPVGALDTMGLRTTWEALLVVRGRQLAPGVRDWLRAMPARFGGRLPGRKPLAFCAWLFDCLGMQPGDVLDDLYPGTGIVGAAWRELSRRSSSDASPTSRDPSPATDRDASPGAGVDASPRTSRDPSRTPAVDASRSAVSDASRVRYQRLLPGN
jgi:hypothetical protein